MIRIARGYPVVMAGSFALVSASCATTDPQRAAVAQDMAAVAASGTRLPPQPDNGTFPTLSQDEVARLAVELQRQAISCWSPPAVNVTAVTVRFTLKKDGSLAGEPTLVKTAQGPQSQAVAESALSAVRNCAPFTLPADKYEWWQEVEVNFDTTRMFSSATLRPSGEHRLSGETDARP
ncbi:MAG: cell envelope integrity protein TolA [Bradyrhizobiaceae bacterium]|nr:cell envelope integrity protein TolA [Bradyrhizobiaceae bacterium]